jgi:Ca-activated chloride channel family protein
VVRIQSPQGTLSLRQKNHTDYAKGVKSLIRPSGKPGVVNVHDMATDEKYLVGTYDLEVLTLPKTYLREVAIKQSETTTLELPAPGILHIDLITQGYGSIYKVSPDGSQEWVIDLEQDKTRIMLTMQPGNYKIAFRAKDAFGSKFTEVTPFNITSGRTVNVKLFGK